MTTGISNTDIETQAAQASPEAVEEFNGMMDDIASAQRDPNVPEGTFLGAGQVNGIPATFHKQSSMHHIGDVALPERLPLYHYPDNEISQIPTALVFRRLSKTIGGHRVWSRAPHLDGREQPFIMKEVPQLDGGTITRRFASELAYESFMKNKHGDQWESMLRTEERAERAEARKDQRDLMQAVLAAAGGGAQAVEKQPAIPAALIEHLSPDGLKALADEFQIELSDRRSAEKMREDLREALGGTDGS